MVHFVFTDLRQEVVVHFVDIQFGRITFYNSYKNMYQDQFQNINHKPFSCLIPTSTKVCMYIYKKKVQTVMDSWQQFHQNQQSPLTEHKKDHNI